MEIIEYVAIDRISLPENRLRERIPHNKIRELGQSILAVGMLNPLVLRPGRDEQLFLVCGHRRYRAAREVGLDRVPALIIPMDEKRAEEFSLVDNTLREPLTDRDLIRAYSRRQGRDDKVAFCRALGWNVSRIAELCAKVDEICDQRPRGQMHIKGMENMRLVDNTVQKAMDLIKMTPMETYMLREEDELQVSYTIRVKKSV